MQLLSSSLILRYRKPIQKHMHIYEAEIYNNATLATHVLHQVLTEAQLILILTRNYVEARPYI